MWHIDSITTWNIWKEFGEWWIGEWESGYGFFWFWAGRDTLAQLTFSLKMTPHTMPEGNSYGFINHLVYAMYIPLVQIRPLVNIFKIKNVNLLHALFSVHCCNEISTQRCSQLIIVLGRRGAGQGWDLGTNWGGRDTVVYWSL